MNKGSAFVTDIGDGFAKYEIVTSDDGRGVQFLVNAEGKAFSLTFGMIYRDPRAAKYGEPVPVAAPVEEQAA